jgi:hypothetical protein
LTLWGWWCADGSSARRRSQRTPAPRSSSSIIASAYCAPYCWANAAIALPAREKLGGGVGLLPVVFAGAAAPVATRVWSACRGSGPAPGRPPSVPSLPVRRSRPPPLRVPAARWWERLMAEPTDTLHSSLRRSRPASESVPGAGPKIPFRSQRANRSRTVCNGPWCSGRSHQGPEPDQRG